MYYRGAAAAILVFDVTRKESFRSLKDWVSGVHCFVFFFVCSLFPLGCVLTCGVIELKQQGHPNVEIAIAANKVDLQSARQVSLSLSLSLSLSVLSLFFVLSFFLCFVPTVCLVFSVSRSSTLNRALSLCSLFAIAASVYLSVLTPGGDRWSCRKQIVR